MKTGDAKAPVKNCFRVLVVDDNEADRKLLTIHLGQAWPFERDLVVEVAADGPEALEKMHGSRFALIVLDWKLPTIGGAEVLRAMRKNGVRIPVVVVSGLAREHISDDLDSLGAAFLNKDELNVLTFHDAIATSLRLLRVSH